MIQKKDCFEFGIIGRPVGLKGEMNLKIDSDNPHYYSSLDALFLEINNSLVPYFLTKISINDKGIARVKFEDINSKNEAQNITGYKVFLPIQALPQLNDNQFYFHEIIDYKVFEKKHGEIGIIKDVAENSNNPLFIIDNKGKEILIPVSDETIEKINKKDKELHLIAPEGLIELYLEN